MRLAVALWLVPSLALAAQSGQDIVLHGNQNGAMPCAACHGANGAGNAAIGAPPLAGLQAAQIESYLADFAKGQGDDIMEQIAKALSPAETQAVATYFAGLPKP